MQRIKNKITSAKLWIKINLCEKAASYSFLIVLNKLFYAQIRGLFSDLGFFYWILKGGEQ